MDIRKELFWHPVHGEVSKLSGDDCAYENKDTIAHEAPIYIDKPMETVYERDRRLWVEAAMLKEIVEKKASSDINDINYRTAYYYKAYDLIQHRIAEFVNAKNQNQ